jgi:HIRAN domain
MFIFIILVIILIFLFNSGSTSSNDKDDNDIRTRNNMVRDKPQELSKSLRFKNRADVKISGADLVIGDTVKMKSGNTYNIIKKNSNGTLTGKEIKTGRLQELYISVYDLFILMDDIYINEQIASLEKTKKQVPVNIKNNKISGKDLVVGNLVTLKSDKTYRIIEKNKNGTFLGVNVRTKEELTLYASVNDYFILINGVYIHEDLKVKKMSPKGKSNKVQNSPEGEKQIPLPKLEKANKIGKKIKFKVSGLSFNGRIKLLEKAQKTEKVFIVKDNNNKYNKNALIVLNSRREQLGWVPIEVANSINITNGKEHSAEIIEILTNRGKIYGLEVQTID